MNRRSVTLSGISVDSLFLPARRPNFQDWRRHTEHMFAKFVYIDALYQKGWIADPNGKAKSIVFTDEGARLAQEFLTRYFGK